MVRHVFAAILCGINGVADHPFFFVETGDNSDDEEEKTQERLAKRFTKRARMQRMEDMYAESQEFSQQRMIDEDETMMEELKKIKVRHTIVSSFCRFRPYGCPNNCRPFSEWSYPQALCIFFPKFTLVRYGI